MTAIFFRQQPESVDLAGLISRELILSRASVFNAEPGMEVVKRAKGKRADSSEKIASQCLVKFWSRGRHKRLSVQVEKAQPPLDLDLVPASTLLTSASIVIAKSSSVSQRIASHVVHRIPREINRPAVAVVDTYFRNINRQVLVVHLGKRNFHVNLELPTSNSDTQEVARPMKATHSLFPSYHQTRLFQRAFQLLRGSPDFKPQASRLVDIPVYEWRSRTHHRPPAAAPNPVIITYVPKHHSLANEKAQQQFA
ncbi:hypothetical protein HYFRA_00013156 [Hymenoscyphus fraxineus]|uniref:Uncharacterized protein n=1 Tax=Hymenoscyphus fraxineus TaxID=746836 RepID=A0A9N9PMP8_9HELO|nr:hypothetical protein HYFRA_00013156 [Hymenoscyphus fraxineus]